MTGLNAKERERGGDRTRNERDLFVIIYFLGGRGGGDREVKRERERHYRRFGEREKDVIYLIQFRNREELGGE